MRLFLLQQAQKYEPLPPNSGTQRARVHAHARTRTRNWQQSEYEYGAKLSTSRAPTIRNGSRRQALNGHKPGNPEKG